MIGGRCGLAVLHDTSELHDKYINGRCCAINVIIRVGSVIIYHRAIQNGGMAIFPLCRFGLTAERPSVHNCNLRSCCMFRASV